MTRCVHVTPSYSTWVTLNVWPVFMWYPGLRFWPRCEICLVKSSICNGWMDPGTQSSFIRNISIKVLSVFWSNAFKCQKIHQFFQGFSMFYPLDPIPKKLSPRPRTWVWCRMGPSRPWGQRGPRRQRMLPLGIAFGTNGVLLPCNTSWMLFDRSRGSYFCPFLGLSKEGLRV